MHRQLQVCLHMRFNNGHCKSGEAEQRHVEEHDELLKKGFLFSCRLGNLVLAKGGIANNLLNHLKTMHVHGYEIGDSQIIPEAAVVKQKNLIKKVDVCWLVLAKALIGLFENISV